MKERTEMWLAKRAAPQNVISVISFLYVGLVCRTLNYFCPTEMKERAEIISFVSFLSVGLVCRTLNYFLSHRNKGKNRNVAR
jgi:hypothetical protein